MLRMNEMARERKSIPTALENSIILVGIDGGTCYDEVYKAK